MRIRGVFVSLAFLSLCLIPLSSAQATTNDTICSVRSSCDDSGSIDAFNCLRHKIENGFNPIDQRSCVEKIVFAEGVSFNIKLKKTLEIDNERDEDSDEDGFGLVINGAFANSVTIDATDLGEEDCAFSVNAHDVQFKDITIKVKKAGKAICPKDDEITPERVDVTIIAEDDPDEDGKGNDEDNCDQKKNSNQADRDGDEVGDACDKCPDHDDPDQRDSDNDGVGDACDDPEPPAPPTDPTDLVGELAGTSPDHSVQLTWEDHSDDEEGFRVERGELADGETDCADFTELKTVADDTTESSDDTVESGKTYCYRVFAFNGDVDSAHATNTVQVEIPEDEPPPTPPADKPEAPTELAATAIDSESVQVTWEYDDTVTILGFRVERGDESCDDASFTQVADVADDTARDYTDSGLTAGTTYCYRVKAYVGDPAVTSDPSPTATATTATDTDPPIDVTPPGDPNDQDGDTVPNDSDNCASISNTDQADGDGDGLGDACDPNPSVNGSVSDEDSQIVEIDSGATSACSMNPAGHSRDLLGALLLLFPLLRLFYRKSR